MASRTIEKAVTGKNPMRKNETSWLIHRRYGAWFQMAIAAGGRQVNDSPLPWLGAGPHCASRRALLSAAATVRRGSATVRGFGYCFHLFSESIFILADEPIPDLKNPAMQPNG